MDGEWEYKSPGAPDFGGCGGCGCCKRRWTPPPEYPEPDFDVPPKKAEIDTAESEDYNWSCAEFTPDRDQNWCETWPREDGLQFAPSSGESCGCKCCQRETQQPKNQYGFKSSFAPNEFGWECATEFPPGKGVDWCATNPTLDPFEYSTEGCSGCSCCRRALKAHPAVNQSLVSELPEMDVIFLPEVESDASRMTQFYHDAFLYLPGSGKVGIREFYGVNCMAWPTGGRYDRVDHFMAQLTRDPRNTPNITKWWRGYSNNQVNFARATPDGKSTTDSPHHCGCGLSHLTLWLSAIERKVHPVVVLESDASVTWFQASGYPEDFHRVIVELAKIESQMWDIAILDHCRHGTTGGGWNLDTPGTRGHYTAYPFVGMGWAGAAMYMVSESFLDKLDNIIHATPFLMVDAWIDIICGRHQVRCVSICAF